MNHITHSDLWWMCITTDDFQHWVLHEQWEVESASCGPLDAPVERAAP